MRFTTAWANVTSQNVTLRVILFILSALLALMSVIAAKAIMKDPIVIERACYSSPLAAQSIEHTPIEVEAFVRESLRQRFDSEASPNPDYLSVEEFKIRFKEQDELKKRQMKQRIIVNSVNKKDGLITVDTDRLISVGSIRSAFSFPLTVSIATVSRSESNPYGLVLVKATSAAQGENHEKK